MKPGLSVGMSASLTWIVDASMVITLGGDSRATVFSTPNMILLMERTAREALRPWLAEDEESVGIDVSIQHLAGAGMGSVVHGFAQVTAIDGRRVHFSVEVREGSRLLGQGTHVRAIVPLSKIIDNLASTSAESHLLTPAKNTGDRPEFRTLQLSLDQQTAILSLSRPNSLNAVNVEMTTELEQAVAWLAGHPQDVRVVLLTGSGRAFCAGDDVLELPSLSLEAARELSLRQATLYLAFERLPQPVIALVNGDAFGAGCVAACAADMRIAVHSARFAMPEIRLGWPPGYGIAQLTALIGKARTLEMCLTGSPITAMTAHAWGLVNDVVPASQLLRRGHEIAQRMKALPAEALRETKRLVHLDEGVQPKVAHRADTDAYIRCLATADSAEGIAAFAEKRRANFRDP